MNIYEIYFVFATLVLAASLTWRLPTLAAMARRMWRGGLCDAMAMCTGPGDPLSVPQLWCLASFAAALIAHGLLSARSYPLYRTYHYTPAACNTLLAVHVTTGATIAPFISLLVDRWGRVRACVVCGLTLAAAAAVTLLAMGSYGGFIFATALHGVGYALLRIAYEAWLLSDGYQRRMDGAWLTAVASLMTATNGIVGMAAATGGELLVLLSSTSDPSLAFVAALSIALASAVMAAGMTRGTFRTAAASSTYARHCTHGMALSLQLTHFRRMGRNPVLWCLSLLHITAGAVLALGLALWVPTLQLLDDLLPYGLCGMVLLLAEVSGASLCGLLFRLCEHVSRSRGGATGGDGGGDFRMADICTAPHAVLEVYRPLAGLPSVMACGLAAAACTTIALTIYPVFTMSAFVALSFIKGFAETALFVWRALLVPNAYRTTAAAGLRVMPELASLALLLHIHASGSAATPASSTAPLVSAPDETQRVAAIGALLCVVAAAATMRMGTALRGGSLVGKRTAAGGGDREETAPL